MKKDSIQNEICDLKHKTIDDKIEKFSYMIQQDLKEIKNSVNEIKEHMLGVTNRVSVIEDETAIVRWLSKNPKTFIFLLAILISILMSEGYAVVVKLLAGII
jgi:hypothetical protein